MKRVIILVCFITTLQAIIIRSKFDYCENDLNDKAFEYHQCVNKLHQDKKLSNKFKPKNRNTEMSLLSYNENDIEGVVFICSKTRKTTNCITSFWDEKYYNIEPTESVG